MEVGPRAIEHTLGNAKRLKTDAASAVSVGGNSVPENPQSADAASAVSANVGSDKGYKLASGS